jgi:hypothetical protein
MMMVTMLGVTVIVARIVLGMIRLRVGSRWLAASVAAGLGLSVRN